MISRPQHLYWDRAQAQDISVLVYSLISSLFFLQDFFHVKAKRSPRIVSVRNWCAWELARKGDIDWLVGKGSMRPVWRQYQDTTLGLEQRAFHIRLYESHWMEYICFIAVWWHVGFAFPGQIFSILCLFVIDCCRGPLNLTLRSSASRLIPTFRGLLPDLITTQQDVMIGKASDRRKSVLLTTWSYGDADRK